MQSLRQRQCLLPIALLLSLGLFQYSVFNNITDVRWRTKDSTNGTISPLENASDDLALADDARYSSLDSHGNTTIKSNIQSDVESHRPTLLMHVGPGKMGTTFLQCSFCTVDALDALREDDYVYIGICTSCKERGVSALSRHSFFSDIVDDFDPIEPFDNVTLQAEFVDRLNSIKANGQNGIIVDEALTNRARKRHVKALAKFLLPDWHIRVVVAYRRLYELLPSFYNEFNRPQPKRFVGAWPGEVKDGREGVEILPFDLENRGKFTRHVLKIESNGRFQTEDDVRLYEPYFPNIEIVDLHNLKANPAAHGSPYLQHLLCHSVSEAANSCGAAQSGRIGHIAETNPSTPLTYHILAQHAHRQGLIRRNVSRPEAVSAIRHYQEETLNLTSNDFPLTCLSNKTLDRLLNLSLTVEASLFSETYAKKQEAGHRAGFELAKAAHKYCHVNADRVFKDKEWRNMLANLEEEGP